MQKIKKTFLRLDTTDSIHTHEENMCEHIHNPSAIACD